MSTDLAIATTRDTDSWAAMLPAVGDLASKIASTSFVPRGLRALAGVPTALEPTWPEWTAPVRRHPPLPKRPEPHPTLF